MSAYLNALREEGSREDLLREIERQWDSARKAEQALARIRAYFRAGIDDRTAIGCIGQVLDEYDGRAARAALQPTD